MHIGHFFLATMLILLYNVMGDILQLQRMNSRKQQCYECANLVDGLHNGM